MPIKVTITTSGVDYPRTKRLEWREDLNLDESNVSKLGPLSNTETEISTEIYFEDAAALAAYQTVNADKLIILNTMRSANSMVVTSRTEEVIDTIP